MTTISEINKDIHKKIMLSGVKVEDIGNPRFVKTRFDKDKDKEKPSIDHTTGIRQVTIADDTGSIIYEEWNPKDDLKVGDEVEFINAHTKYDDYREEYRLGISKKKDGALMLNRTALAEKRPDGNYLREDNSLDGAIAGAGGKKKETPTEKKKETPESDTGIILDPVAIIEAIQKNKKHLETLEVVLEGIDTKLDGIVDELGENQGAVMSQIKAAMAKIQPKASKKKD